MLNSHGNVFSFSKGRCYDHNFVRFSQKNSVMITVVLMIGADFQDVYLLKRKLTQTSHIVQCRWVPRVRKIG
jgi:hypothetical protein